MRFDYLETKGDVTFYQGEGEMVYQLIQLENDQLMIPSNLGLREEARELPVQSYKTYEILYDGLGERGFSIRDANGFFVEEGFWKIFEAVNHILDQLEFPCEDCGSLISFQGTSRSGCSEVCLECEEHFCSYCVEWSEEEQGYICHSCLTKH